MLILFGFVSCFVNNGEFLEFIVDGGYGSFFFWFLDGWVVW